MVDDSSPTPAVDALEKAGYHTFGAHFKMDNSAGVVIIRTPVLKKFGVFIWFHEMDYVTPSAIMEHVTLGTPYEISSFVRRHEELRKRDLAELTADLILAITCEEKN